MQRFLAPLAAVLAMATVLPATARAETADEILAAADKLTNGWPDLFMRTTMTITDIDGKTKSYVYSIYQKGAKRLVRFESGELKGMATMVLEDGKVYAYLPGFKKIRRVATHAMNQSFAGSDFSNDDLAFTSWPGTYVAKIDHEDADNWYLACTAKPGGLRAPFPKAMATVRKKDHYMTQYVFYDDNGQKTKTFDMRNVKDWGGGVIRGEIIEVTDNRTGHKTRLDLSEFKVNLGLKDSMFTERELQWGE